MRLKADMVAMMEIADKLRQAAYKNNDEAKQEYYMGVKCALEWATDRKDSGSSCFYDTADIQKLR